MFSSTSKKTVSQVSSIVSPDLQDYLEFQKKILERVLKTPADLPCGYFLNIKLSFKQTNWLAPYIAKNTNLCQQAKNSSVYGKTMENVHKYQDIKLMRMINENDEKKFL
ncbi:hypothetical protein RhiirB3_456475 [Rhizophagus irregularis]|nr:hypothetical protein RhiirB3_456475 [Rhizophagus irregularis]